MKKIYYFSGFEHHATLYSGCAPLHLNTRIFFTCLNVLRRTTILDDEIIMCGKRSFFINAYFFKKNEKIKKTRNEKLYNIARFAHEKGSFS